MDARNDPGRGDAFHADAIRAPGGVLWGRSPPGTLAHRVEAIVHRAAGRAAADRLHQPVQLVVAVVLTARAAAQALALEVAVHVVAVAQLPQGAAGVAVGQTGELAGLELVRRREGDAVAEGFLRDLPARVCGIRAPVFD